MLTRRRLLVLSAAGFAYAGGIRLALASAPTDNRVVVVVLRGAMDGLAAVPPYGDKDYAGQRGSLAFAEPGKTDGCLDLDGHFGLNPALAPLMPLWQSGELAVLHAAATPYRARSHFDGQDMLETGGASHALAEGWLNRAIAEMPKDGHSLALSVGPSVPLILRGPAEVGSWSPEQILPAANQDLLDRLADLYRDDPLFSKALADGLQAQKVSQQVMGASGVAVKSLKREDYLPAAAKGVGELLADPRGPRVAVLEALGWDTHQGQGLTTGRLPTALKGLADSLTALKQAMQPVWSLTTVVVATEFGRTVAPNGTNGTDHGTGTAAFVLGGNVEGKRVIADWPGLSNDRLYQGRDLAPTTDLRAVFKAICQRPLGLDEMTVENKIFPDSRSSPAMSDLLRA